MPLAFGLHNRSKHMGNPSILACWLDESHNRVLAQVCRGSHAATHDVNVLNHFSLFQKLDEKRLKKKPRT